MTKQTLLKISHLGQDAAIIIRKDHSVDNLAFFTDDLNPLQVGIHEKSSNVKLDPHIHLSDTKVISEVQEVLYIVYGKLKVTYYTIDGDIIQTEILSEGDTLVHYRMGHGFETLEPTRILEVKQGPYPGTQHAKIYLKKKAPKRDSSK